MIMSKRVGWLVWVLAASSVIVTALLAFGDNAKGSIRMRESGEHRPNKALAIVAQGGPDYIARMSYMGKHHVS